MFSLPAVATCPGATAACRSACYARRGRFHGTAVKRLLAANLAAARRLLAAGRLAPVLTAAVDRAGAAVVRVHAAGDLFSVAYARAWLAVAAARPGVRFYLYTRSWRRRPFGPVLRDLAALPNVRLFYSIDRDSGVPTGVPPRVRLAYMAAAAADVPPPEADLVFLDRPLRRTRTVRLNGTLVCPLENGTGWAGTCDKCGLCVDPLEQKDPRARKRPPAPPGRTALPVVG